ncbi:phosphatase PAP2 family protein [Caproiciproducens faecalis]|uniref:Phosphatase PAP2 family protein n=1 Tax=Caproiciproducens faecalis TaxID=2820301 RepID=A0ABS7DPN7_9FIRM|nr:phosphatase PAP2 family protein [Caproiciproducens faecalis]MBW7572521.1 phosphatase PAP2 family protein [Caproiciproducens faecalis]
MDEFILIFIQNHFHNGFTDLFFPFITVLGNAGLIWVVSGLCLICTKKYRFYGVMLLAALVLTHTLGEGILKPLVARPRPFAVYSGYHLLIAAPRGYSFPSGHAGAAFAAAFVLGKANRRLGIPAFALAFLIAFSRVFLFVHYPSDILAGAILGVLSAGFICLLFKKT